MLVLANVGRYWYLLGYRARILPRGAKNDRGNGKERISMQQAAVVNAAVVTGDGKTWYEQATVYIQGDRIEGIDPRRLPAADVAELARRRRVIDGDGLVVWPG